VGRGDIDPRMLRTDVRLTAFNALLPRSIANGSMANCFASRNLFQLENTCRILDTNTREITSESNETAIMNVIEIEFK